MFIMLEINRLGADLTRGPDQNPWNGELDYDFIMWIDSTKYLKLKISLICLSSIKI